MLVFLSAFAVWSWEAGLRTPNYGKLSTTQDGIRVKVRHGGQHGMGMAEWCHFRGQHTEKIDMNPTVTASAFRYVR